MQIGVVQGRLASFRGVSNGVLLGLMFLLPGCVSNQAKVSMLQAPEVADASKYKSVSVARFGGQFGESISTDLEAALLNAKVQDKPVYRSVVRAPESRALGGDHRSMATAARSLNTEAIFVGEVTQANVNDVRSQREEYVCDRRENPNKIFSKCLSGHNQTVHCTDRTATLEVQVKLIDAQNGNQIYAEAIAKNISDSACSGSSPKDGKVMLGSLKAQIIDQIKTKVVPHERMMNIGLMDSVDGIRADAARNRFEGAIKFGKENRMDRACEMFREVYDSERKSVALAYNLGVCEEAAGAYWKAEEYYRLADQMTNEPNKLITAALSRNAANLKKAGSLAQNRADLIGSATIESGAAPQTVKSKGAGGNYAMESATKLVPQAPQDITPETLMLEKRTALVVGNAAYKRGALSNPVNDARAIASVLRKLNFRVIQVENASYAKMGLAVEEFGRAIKEGGVALVFYAGHGMQVKGENYLVPVDADLKDEGDVAYKTLALGQILAKLETARPRVNIIMLDACRDNPFARSWRSTKGGLASIDAPSGTLIAFATAPGKTAADGIGSNGLYTSHLLKQLEVPNQKIEDVLKNTRKAVAAASNNEQIPWDSSSLTGDFYFKVSANALQTPKADVQAAVVPTEPSSSTTRSASRDESAAMPEREQEEASKPSLGGFFNSLSQSVKGLLDN